MCQMLKQHFEIKCLIHKNNTTIYDFISKDDFTMEMETCTCRVQLPRNS
jgi:hypothetical protein